MTVTKWPFVDALSFQPTDLPFVNEPSFRDRLPLWFDQPELDCFELGDGTDACGQRRRDPHRQSMGSDGSDRRDHAVVGALFRNPPGRIELNDLSVALGRSRAAALRESCRHWRVS